MGKMECLIVKFTMLGLILSTQIQNFANYYNVRRNHNAN